MSIEIKTEIKPLVANILRLNISQYFAASHYRHLLLEHDFDLLWEQTNKLLSYNNGVSISGIGSVPIHFETFIHILNYLFPDYRELFFRLLKITLIDFIWQDNSKTDMTKIFSNLEKLNMPSQDLQEIRDAYSIDIMFNGESINLKSIKPSLVIIDVDPNLCFVLMPFDKIFAPIYETIIKPVVTSLNLKCLRADEIFTSKPIIDDILNNIKKSHLLIADLTDRNPNVFYELGLAHALNKDVILLTQNIHDVPFDLKHYRIIVYENSISGADKFKLDLKKFIQEILKIH